MNRLRFLQRIEDAQRHRIAVVVQRRVADHALTATAFTLADLDFHQLGQFAEAPVGHARVFGRRFVRLGKLLTRLPAPFGAQIVQVAAHRQLSPVFVDKQEIEREVC